MKAVEASLLNLLGKSSQFVIPIYQRTYSWKRSECEQLWSDILRAGQDDALNAHFTGSVVHIEKGLAALTEFEPNLIIDGQQRVTTMTLLLVALAERLEQLPGDQREPLDGFSPKKIRNRYLVNPDEEGERQYKLLLSQADKTTLTSIVDKAPEPPSASERVTDNFEFFGSRLADPKTDLTAVCRGIAKLVVVDVRLDRTQDNPQLIFESMNSTGRQLSQADLIRNYVLMGLEPKLQTHLYNSYWRPMELEFGQGAYEDRFDEFVRHYLTVVTGEIPRLGDIYEAFKKYSRGFFEHGQTVEELVIELFQYSRRYCALALGKETDDRLRRAFKDLDQIKADVVYPFLLEVYTDYELETLSRNDVLTIVDMVTSYIFRRAVCRVPTNSLNTTFATFGKALRKDRYVDSVRAHFLSMKNYRAFPSDSEFAESLKTTDLYNFKRRSYFLRVMENHGRKEHVSVEDYTIEHVLPQNENLSSEWRKALGDDWHEVQERYLHTLGNLTLTGYNSEYSDHPFATKRDMDGGFKDSPLRLNQGLGQLETWNADEIEKRAERLAREALKIWTRPQLTDEQLQQFEVSRPDTGFTIEDHPNLLAPARRELFERLSKETLALDPAITRHFLKLYVAFKAETNFLDVIPQVARLRLTLNIPLENLRDERGLAYDVSGKGHWGNGPTEVALNEESDFAYVMGLVRQALEYQLGE
jgi:uncharacterized protein with ParB-like and HNH nuclease domain/predicted transport protein